ncbi:hypothetical protein G7Y89_g3426 [Cudoniella acicularis]|uniref:Uncharacterized protein n=1 Tax=Cudoniella acicularis TaxID=354080 RepID=A0A8H4RUE1_9HELO|nr:hypothetical protein G7Y89_g3426 [Cudoniella acicularis]
MPPFVSRSASPSIDIDTIPAISTKPTVNKGHIEYPTEDPFPYSMKARFVSQGRLKETLSTVLEPRHRGPPDIFNRRDREPTVDEEEEEHDDLEYKAYIKVTFDYIPKTRLGLRTRRSGDTKLPLPNLLAVGFYHFALTFDDEYRLVVRDLGSTSLVVVTFSREPGGDDLLSFVLESILCLRLDARKTATNCYKEALRLLRSSNSRDTPSENAFRELVTNTLKAMAEQTGKRIVVDEADTALSIKRSRDARSLLAMTPVDSVEKKRKRNKTVTDISDSFGASLRE